MGQARSPTLCWVVPRAGIEACDCWCGEARTAAGWGTSPRAQAIGVGDEDSAAFPSKHHRLFHVKHLGSKSRRAGHTKAQRRHFRTGIWTSGHRTDASSASGPQQQVAPYAHPCEHQTDAPWARGESCPPASANPVARESPPGSKQLERCPVLCYPLQLSTNALRLDVDRIQPAGITPRGVYLLLIFYLHHRSCSTWNDRSTLHPSLGFFFDHLCSLDFLRKSCHGPA